MMRKLDNVTKSVAVEKGASFVDLASKPIWEDSDFYDFSHMTPEGAQKVGTLLYEALKNKCTDAEKTSPQDKK